MSERDMNVQPATQNIVIADQQETRFPHLRRTIAIGAICVVGVGSLFTGGRSGESVADEPTEAPTATSAPEYDGPAVDAWAQSAIANSKSAERKEEVACATTWEFKEAKVNSENRWFLNGVKEIKEAETKKEAESAAMVWVDKIKQHPQLLATSLNHFLELKGEDRIEQKDLVDKENCATDDAVSLTDQLKLAMVADYDINVGEHPDPANAVNTGLNKDGEVTKAAHTGVSGNTRGLIFTSRKDGCVTMVFERCGQLVFVTECDEPIPEGPTDEPPKRRVVPEKTDDGKLPAVPGAPAREQDGGTPDSAGEGPAGQTPNDEGRVPGERRPTQPRDRSNTGGNGGSGEVSPNEPTGDGSAENPKTGEQEEAEPEPVQTEEPQPTATEPPKPN